MSETERAQIPSTKTLIAVLEDDAAVSEERHPGVVAIELVNSLSTEDEILGDYLREKISKAQSPEVAREIALTASIAYEVAKANNSRPT